MTAPVETKILWEEMFPDEFVELRNRHPVCYMAYGLAEPHGPYNALGLDFVKARAIVERAAREHGGIVAPPFAWHIQENPAFHTGPEGWLTRVGVIQPLSSSISTELFFKTALYQIRAFDARGFRAAILVTGHYGGLEKTLRLLCEHYLEQSGSPIRLYACADWELIDYQDYRGDHAGVCETSQLMALRPELVDLKRTAAPAELGERFAGTAFPDSKGRSPDRDAGERIVQSQIRTLGEMGGRLLAEYVPVEDWQAPSWTDLDAFWSCFETATRQPGE
jgi:creatinine amidohydrolase/Fe(II)-dependent formamide hydrolase-like protein